MKYLIILLFILAEFSFAKPMPLSGRVMELSGIPVENENTRFNVKIKNIATCVLFEEEFLTDLSGSNGYFKIVLTNGTNVFNGNGFDIFRGKTFNCKDGTTWSASNTDVRLIEISLKVGDQPWVNFSSDTINSIAYANESDYLNGKSSIDFIQTSSSTTQLKVDDLLNQYTSIIELVNGLNSTYAKQSLVDTALLNKQNVLSYTPINPGNNLSELTNFAQARSNLGLGTLSTKSLVTDADISSVDWIKVGNKPTTYPPSTHSHNVSEITSLSNLLNSKVDKSTFTCSSTQVLLFNSILDSFSCSDISLAGDVSGTASANSITKLQGKNVYINSPQDGMILRFSGSNDRWEAVNLGSTSTPKTFAGEVILFPATCPSGTVLADGRTLDQSTYFDLYTNLGCSYGCPTASTFKIPDYRGLFLRGKNNGRSDGNQDPDGDRTLGNIQGDNFRSHNHGGGYHDHGGGNHRHDSGYSIYQNDSLGHHAPGGGVGHLTRPGWYFHASQAQPDVDVYSGNIISPQAVVNTEGGNETRPRNISVNYCMRLQNGY